jgi:hypothetical protein
MTHAAVRRLLYDSVSGSLPPELHEAVEKHLRACPKCVEHRRRLRDALALLTRTTGRPSDERPPAYWNAFARSVEERIRIADVPSSPWARIAAFLDEVLATRRPLLAVAGGALVVLVGLSFLLRPGITPTLAPPPQQTAERVVPHDTSAGEHDNRKLASYFRRSKALLVGLEHLNRAHGTPVDLSTERRVSEELLREARALRSIPLDPRSAQLIGDLARFQADLAGPGTAAEERPLDMIQSDVRQGNLLFKVRMAEMRLARARGEIQR